MSKSPGRFQSIRLGSAIAVALLMAANAYAEYRDELAKDRAHAKAWFMEQATGPFHP